MNSLNLRSFLLLCWLVPVAAFGQPSIQLKLQLINYDTWGVYAKPMAGINPGPLTITGTAMATVVMPKTYAWNSLTSVHGTWNDNAIVDGPIENPTRKYVSFGLNNDYPHINYVAGQETLLFKFKRVITYPCPDSIYLINNATDPFNQLPNSMNTNPGNEFSVFDPVGPAFYEYHSNYAHSAWSCHDNDADGTPNAFEDTNGNGIFDAGDASDLNVHNGGMSLKLKLMEPNKWGVYVKPDSTITPGSQTITGTAQVTVVMPNSYAWNTPISIHGTWAANAAYNGPSENPNRYYVSFGLMTDFPHIDYVAGQETLLFTFKGNGTCPDSMYLIDNAADPLNQLPNSWNSNPGNELTVFDPDNGANYNLYTYHQNYAPSAWSCHDNDGDGILNAFEDTNGNGVFDPGVDASDLNAGCGPVYSLMPQNIKTCSGNSVTFTTTAAVSQDSFGFGWQFSDDGGISWTDIDFTLSGSNFTHTSPMATSSASDTLTILNTAGMDGWRFRALANSTTCPIVLSNIAILDVDGPIHVLSQPALVTYPFESEVSFVAKAINEGSSYPLDPSATLTYHIWQKSTDGGSSWNNLTNLGNNIYTGISGTSFSMYYSDTLTISNTTGLNGNQYRICYSSPNCTIPIYSDAATLELDCATIFTNDPNDVTNCSGSDATFTATAINPQSVFTFGWHYSDDNGATWVDIDFTTMSAYFTHTITGAVPSGTDVLTVKNVSFLMGNRRFRAVAQASSCNAVYSEDAKLNAESIITITDQPDNVTQCSGDIVSFTVGITNSSPQGNLPAYQWQESTNGGASWHNLMNDTLYYGTNTNQLNIASTTWFNGYMYRCHVSTTYCNDLFSDAATLNFEGPIIVTDEPDNVTVCAGSGASFQAVLVNSGLGVLQYQWEVSSDNGFSWSNLQNDGNHSGVTTTTLSIADATNMYNNRFRMHFRTANCNGQWTNWAVLTVQDCPDACLKLKLQLLPDSSGWAVMAKPFGGYVPTANAMTTAGRVTLVAPANFVLDGLTNIGGNWTPTNVLSNVPGHPGRKYITFELATSAQGTQIGYDFNEAITLFQFEKNNGCPDSLYLLETDIPNIQPNELNGEDTFGQLPNAFGYCGVYARKSWRCKAASTPGGTIIIVATEDSLSAPQTEAVDRDAEFSEGQTLAEGQSFTLAPNPAGSFVNITVSENLAEGQTTLALWDLQGRKHQEILLKNTITQLDLGDLPAGMYMVSLAQNGRVVERKKLVKN